MILHAKVFSTEVVTRINNKRRSIKKLFSWKSKKVRDKQKLQH